MQLDVLDQQGKKLEALKLNEKIFGITPNVEAIAQYVRVFQHNQRQGTSSTKTRGEVSGGGRKPWRQKGTGRARHGSSRSPLWSGGGVTHGPKPKSWNLKINKKIRQLVLASILSQKYTAGKLTAINEIKMTNPKTSDFAQILKNVKLDDARKLLVVMNENDMALRKSAANIKNVKTALVSNVSAYELMRSDKVLFLKDAIKKIEEKF